MSESWINRHKSMFPIFISFISFLIIYGCATKPPSSYHSTASITHSSDDTITIMKYVRIDKSLIKEKEFTSSNKKYGVMTALDVKDDGTQDKYLLFAAGKRDGTSMSTVKKFGNLDFSMSAPMTLDKAKALSLKLKLLLDNWGKEMEIDGGLFYEFTITPEHEIKQLSENVISRGYVFRFSFGQFMPPGIFSKPKSRALLQIGRNNLIVTTRLDTKNKLYELKLLIDTAIKQIEDMQGKPIRFPIINKKNS